MGKLVTSLGFGGGAALIRSLFEGYGHGGIKDQEGNQPSVFASMELQDPEDTDHF
jgi:hypothetical protein